MDAYQKPNLSLSPHDRVLTLYNALTTGPATINHQTFQCFDMNPLAHASLLSVHPPADPPTALEPGRTLWSFTCDPTLCNRGGNLHGGCAATLLDSLTSTALLTVARPGFLDGGHVSRTLSCTYLRPVPMGTECVVECWVVAAGRKTANVRGELRTRDGKVCVTCVHDKAVLTRVETDEMNGGKVAKQAKL